MSSPRVTTVFTYGILSLAGVFSFSLPESLVPSSVGVLQAPPDTIELTGILRDFTATHPDFNVVPLGGSGHYAGNLALNLGVDDRPVFVGNGFKVTAQWRDSASRPIAPHLFTLDPTVATVKLVKAPTGLAGATVDSFNSSIGPYGGANVGPAPVFQTGAAMPTITVPSTWDQTLPGTTYTDLTVTFDQDTRFTGDVKFEDNTIVLIDGQISILIEGKLELDPDTAISFQIVLLPGSTLDLYVTGRIRIRDSGNLNMNTGDPRLVTIYALGPGDFEMREGTSLAANIIAPKRTLTIDAGSHVYGRFTGRSIELEGGGGYHHDGTGASTCGIPITDTAGTGGITSSGGIFLAASFDQWYRDILGTNLSTYHAITLIKDGLGVYEFLADAFYPIDGELSGNEGDAHNNYFTYAIEVEFIYQACTGQFFEFMGSDDAWLFVDGNLGIDLGGVIPGTEQYVELDRFGLVDGQTYQLHFFYAHRQPGPPVFRMRTNILLITGDLPSVTAFYD